MDQQTLQLFQSQLNNSQNVLIATCANPSFDAVCSMVSLALSFEKMQKKVSLFCPTPVIVEFGNLVGVNKVQASVGNKNLVVTLKGYASAGVDKVSYNVEGENFNLVVQPKAGSPVFDPASIVYSYSGVDAQLLILVDVQNLEQLGDFYQKEKSVFDSVPIANVDCSTANTNYAKFNLTNAAASSCTEITGYLLQYLKYQVDSDIATNILYGLMQATKNLIDAKVRAETYELIGMMMRMGARRTQVLQLLGQAVLSPVVPVTAQAVAQPTVAVPQSQPGLTNGAAVPSQQPPADWTQPKIYRGGGSIS